MKLWSQRSVACVALSIAGLVATACGATSTASDNATSRPPTSTVFPSAVSSPIENDYHNQAGWVVSARGVGPLVIGELMVDVARIGVAKWIPDNCGPGFPGYTTNEAFRDTLTVYAKKGPNLTLFLIRANGAFRTAEGIGQGTSVARLRAVYGDRIKSLEISPDSGVGPQPVLVEGGSFIAFQSARGSIRSMWIGETKNGKVLIPADWC